MAEWNRDTPWRQGHLLCAKAVAALGLCQADALGHTVVIVATHDCDLAQASQVESTIEVIVGRAINKLDGNFTHAKTPRRLHIEFDSEVSCAAEFEATAKVCIQKIGLAQFSPRADARLSPSNYNIFQFWLASRYRRSAFPDEFERRLTKETKLADRIAKTLKPHGALIAGIFFDVDDGLDITHSGPDDTYTLDIYIMHSAEPDFEAAKAAAQQASIDIQLAFTEKLLTPTKTWQQVELRSCEIVSESVLTYQQFKQLKRWRLEHISLAADPQQPLLEK
ncbi:hypothetical protein [Rugamonas sp. DEMB1]|jgi:hypothetical protein|uniref:hypothetical protein n=1 Tax=Rugamonas sp. DEMB1 TaxID=3039386 RepID=UPI00244C5E89|nr:hypothetical protein [Rugamonas sp. DEMB1]WGG49550.1 hypothetical protein QC826_23905 [Rugamonas sp. DEMB1]